MALEKLLKFLIGAPLPKENDFVTVNATGEKATVISVERNGFGYFEGYAICILRLQNGESLKLLETDFK